MKYESAIWTLVLVSFLCTPTFLYGQSVPIKGGLILDLNADFGTELADGDRVVSWENQVENFQAKLFTYRDEGRKIPGSGRPKMILRNPKINQHSSIRFQRQELVNDDEDAFDHLITGSGYTWFAVLSADKQVQGLKDVNSFLGNLKNSDNYEGFWGNLTDDNRPWMGSRNGITFGRWDVNNPMIRANESLEEGKFYLLIGRMGSGPDTVSLALFKNNLQLLASGPCPVNSNANASRLAIGQERDAIQHPGAESFDGEIARVLIYERPLAEEEISKVAAELIHHYQLN